MADAPDDLSESLAALSRLLVGEESLEATLGRVADLARRTLGGCDVAGVTLLKDGGPTTAACTEETARDIDSAQYQSGAGPCLEAYRQQQVFRVDSMDDEVRWPEFCARALSHGVHSSLSIPLVVNGDGLGGLNLYSRSRDGFSTEDQELGLLLAGQAAVALANAQVYWGAYALTKQLEEALASRDLIGQAKGVIMSQRGDDDDVAFDVLRRASQRENRKLRDVAQDVVDAARKRNGREPQTQS